MLNNFCQSKDEATTKASINYTSSDINALAGTIILGVSVFTFKAPLLDVLIGTIVIVTIVVLRMLSLGYETCKPQFNWFRLKFLILSVTGKVVPIPQ